MIQAILFMIDRNKEVKCRLISCQRRNNKKKYLDLMIRVGMTYDNGISQ